MSGLQWLATQFRLQPRLPKRQEEASIVSYHTSQQSPWDSTKQVLRQYFSSAGKGSFGRNLRDLKG
jgi:3-dehydroquinate dehydratase